MKIAVLENYLIKLRTGLTKRFLKEPLPKGPMLFMDLHTAIHRNKSRVSNWEKLEVKAT